MRGADSLRATEFPFASNEALAYKITFGSVQGDGTVKSALFGTLVWALVAYEVPDIRVESLFFGGCVVPLGMHAPDLEDGKVTVSGGAHDFLIRMPYTVVRGRSRDWEIRTDFNTVLEVDGPDGALAGGGSMAIGGLELESGKTMTAPIVMTKRSLEKYGLTFAPPATATH